MVGFSKKVWRDKSVPTVGVGAINGSVPRLCQIRATSYKYMAPYCIDMARNTAHLDSVEVLGATILEAQFPVPDDRPKVVVAPEDGTLIETISERLTVQE